MSSPGPAVISDSVAKPAHLFCFTKSDATVSGHDVLTGTILRLEGGHVRLHPYLKVQDGSHGGGAGVPSIFHPDSSGNQESLDFWIMPKGPKDYSDDQRIPLITISKAMEVTSDTLVTDFELESAGLLARQLLLWRVALEKKLSSRTDQDSSDVKDASRIVDIVVSGATEKILEIDKKICDKLSKDETALKSTLATVPATQAVITAALVWSEKTRAQDAAEVGLLSDDSPVSGHPELTEEQEAKEAAYKAYESAFEKQYGSEVKAPESIQAFLDYLHSPSGSKQSSSDFNGGASELTRVLSGAEEDPFSDANEFDEELAGELRSKGRHSTKGYSSSEGDDRSEFGLPVGSGEQAHFTF